MIRKSSTSYANAIVVEIYTINVLRKAVKHCLFSSQRPNLDNQSKHLECVPTLLRQRYRNQPILLTSKECGRRWLISISFLDAYFTDDSNISQSWVAIFTGAIMCICVLFFRAPIQYLVESLYWIWTAVTALSALSFRTQFSVISVHASAQISMFVLCHDKTLCKWWIYQALLLNSRSSSQHRAANLPTFAEKLSLALIILDELVIWVALCFLGWRSSCFDLFNSVCRIGA